MDIKRNTNINILSNANKTFQNFIHINILIKTKSFGNSTIITANNKQNKIHLDFPIKLTFKPKITVNPTKYIVLHNTFNDKYITAYKQMLNGRINDKDILQKEFNIFKLKSVLRYDNVLSLIGKAILNELNLITDILITYNSFRINKCIFK